MKNQEYFLYNLACLFTVVAAKRICLMTFGKQFLQIFQNTPARRL